MIDLKQYKWLDSSSIDSSSPLLDGRVEDYLHAIETSEMMNGEKNIYGQYIIDLVLNKDFKCSQTTSKEIIRELKSLKRKGNYTNFKKDVMAKDQGAYVMSGLMIVMCGTMVIFFLNAIARESYLINFNIDAIVGAIAAVFLYKNYQLKYKLINRYTKSKDFLLMDVCSYFLCLVLKIFVVQIDFTLFILFLTYFVSKRQLNKIINEF